MKNVVIAAPNIDGKVDLKFAQALARSIELGALNEVRFHLDFIEHSGTPSTLQKNIICNRVLESDSIDGGILFVGDEISWEPIDILTIVKDDDKVVSGSYPNSTEYAEDYGIEIDPDLDLFSKHIYAKKVPLKFLYVPKKVLQGLTQFVEKNENSDRPFYFFFKEEIIDGVLHEEDYIFSRLVTSSGFDLVVDSSIACVNTARMPLRNTYRAYLAKKWVHDSTDIPQN